MDRRRSSTIRRRGHRASAAEIDALGATIAAAATLAERVRSDAAGLLIRRAALLVAERRPTTFDGAGRGDGEERAGRFSPS